MQCISVRSHRANLALHMRIEFKLTQFSLRETVNIGHVIFSIFMSVIIEIQPFNTVTYVTLAWHVIICTYSPSHPSIHLFIQPSIQPPIRPSIYSAIQPLNPSTIYLPPIHLSPIYPAGYRFSFQSSRNHT